jgi:hypothetical protein
MKNNLNFKINKAQIQPSQEKLYQRNEFNIQKKQSIQNS